MRPLILICLLLMALATGCASVLRFELPAELKGKKLKEDPPITLLPGNWAQPKERCS